MALISCGILDTGPLSCDVPDSKDGHLASRLSILWLPIRHFSINVGNTASVRPAEEPPTGRRRRTANSLHVVLLLTCAPFQQSDRKQHGNMHNSTIKKGLQQKQGGKCNTERVWYFARWRFRQILPHPPNNHDVTLTARHHWLPQRVTSNNWWWLAVDNASFLSSRNLKRKQRVDRKNRNLNAHAHNNARNCIYK